MARTWGRLVLLGAALAARPLAAQHLTLERALGLAAERSFASRAAAAEVRVRRGQATQTLASFLPSVRGEAGYVRTTDPLAAFGALLRRREVTPQAFDPAALNSPAPIGLLSSAVVLEQPLVNLDAWYARQGAARGVRATVAGERWQQIESEVEVTRAYYGAVLAGEQVGTLEDAATAARAHLRQAESLRRNGLVTQSDVLLAAVREREVEIRLVAARRALPVARLRLAVALGEPRDTAFTLPAALPSRERILETAEREGGRVEAVRADVEAALWQEQAAVSETRRAGARLLPRVNAFGRLDWHTADAVFRGQHAWTLGVMVSWSPFSGGAEWGQRRAAEGARLAAGTQAEAVQAQGEIELARATAALAVALEQMALLDTSLTQSREAHRIVFRKYDGGLATVVELLDAAAQETATRLVASQARYDAIVALAERNRARGLDLAPLSTLEEE
jgi:outer membrane protein TolC